MHSNPVLKKLGYQEHDRLVIIHTDDIGMCQASLAAFAELAEFGLISSGATMVPCPWFPAVAAYCRAHPQVDMGVHITLNSEWDAYRWGPVSTRDPATGLLDEEGYLHRSQSAVQQHADPGAVQAEVQAQVQRALAAGIDPTHVDTHMGTVAHPKFIPAYVQLAVQFRLPIMIPRHDQAGYQALGMDAETAALAAQFVLALEAQGIPLLDKHVGLPLDQPTERIQQAKAALSDLSPGLTHFIIHPSIDTPELRAITPDWPSRVADYHAFKSEELRQFVKESGIHVIGYRLLRDLMRQAA
ncbi:MAG: polysaccharide deacetylase family protein [Chloroflexota bacterium]